MVAKDLGKNKMEKKGKEIKNITTTQRMKGREGQQPMNGICVE